MSLAAKKSADKALRLSGKRLWRFPKPACSLLILALKKQAICDMSVSEVVLL